jgi:CHAT domain-containing protein/Tfp pilus assembly protein PilF
MSTLPTVVLMMAVIFTQNAFAQTRDEKLATATKAFDEALELEKKGTNEAVKTAIEKLLSAREIFSQISNKPDEAFTLLVIGSNYRKLKEHQKALEYYNQALSINRVINNKLGEAVVLSNIGSVYSDLSEKRKAIDFYRQSLPIFQSLNDKEKEADSLTFIGNLFEEVGETQKALDYHEMALPIYRALNDKTQEASILVNIGEKYGTLGDRQKELNYYKEAQIIYKSLGDKSSEAYILNGLGAFYSNIGEPEKSSEYFNQALLIYRTLGDKENESMALTGLGNIYLNSSQYQKALESYDASLVVFRELKQKEGEAAILVLIGSVYSVLGEHNKSLEFFKEAIQIFSAIGARYGEATTLNSIGMQYSYLSEIEKALDYYNKSLEISQISGDKGMQAANLAAIGFIYINKKPQVSLKYFEQALQIFYAIQDKSSQALTLNNIGYAHFLSGEYVKASENLNQSLIISSALDNKRIKALSLSTMSAIWNKQKNPRLATFYQKQAINIYQQIRANIKGLDKETQKTYLKEVEPIYRGLAAVLIQNDRLSEAEQVLNLFKDQQFFDFNNAKQSDSLILTDRESASIFAFDKKLETIGNVSRKIDELKRNSESVKSTVLESEKLKQLGIELQKANDDYLAFLKQAEKEFAAPPDEKDKIPTVPDLQQMQTALREISVSTKQKTAAVYTLVGEEYYRALIITPDSISSVSSPVKGENLNQKAQQLWRLLRTPDYDPQQVSKEIYDMVFAPVAAKLPADTKTILWSLDGSLRYIPVSALFDGKQYLVERYNNVLFTRADKDRLTRNIAPNLKGTGFGSSEPHTVKLIGESFNALALPAVKTELSQIFKNGSTTTGIIPGEILLNEHFTKAGMLSELQKRRPLVHIASHFKFEAGDGSRSFLLLGDGTPFTLNEMKSEQNLFAGVDLLTLSACQTAAQRADSSGREVDGFAELAQRLGAGAVMASLWEVSDDSTSELMTRFYRAYNSHMGINKAEALRKAQLALLHGEYKTTGTATRQLTREDELANAMIKIDNTKLKPFKTQKLAPFAHPFYWSPFILIGNWK